MKKKTLALLLTLAMTGSLFAGCGSSASSDSNASSAENTTADTEAGETADGAEAEDTFKAITFGMGYDASSLDPGMTTDDASITPYHLLSETLLRLRDGEPAPGLAESWEVSEDSKIWTFHLRESTFSDGTPVTAETMEYSLKRLVNPENGLDNMASISDISGAEALLNGEDVSVDDLGIEATDEYTLVLTFDYPQYEMDFTSYVYSPVSQELVESAGEAFASDMEYFLGNGPFMLESWTHDAEIVMVKNPNYWDADSVKLDQITMIPGASADTAVDMMSAGTLDAAGYTSQMYLDSALEVPGMTSMTIYNATQSCHLNVDGKTEETGKWLSNVNFRKALSYALDREAMVAAVYTTGTPASTVVPDSEEGKNGAFNDEYSYGEMNTTADAEKAQEYLAKAMEELGVSDASEIPTFTMLAFDSENNVKCLNAIADMWSKTLGINCELDMEPIMEMLNKALSDDFDFWKGGNSVDLDYVDFFGLYDSSAGLGSGVDYQNDEEYHALYEVARNAATWEERKDAEAALAEYWTENMMDIMITWDNSFYVYNEKITGVQEGQMFIDFSFADLAE